MRYIRMSGGNCATHAVALFLAEVANRRFGVLTDDTVVLGDRGRAPDREGLVGPLVAIDRDCHLVTGVERVQLGRKGRCTHDDLASGPLKPDGHDTGRAVLPHISQPCWNRRLEQLPGDGILEQLGATLGHATTPS